MGADFSRAENVLTGSHRRAVYTAAEGVRETIRHADRLAHALSDRTDSARDSLSDLQDALADLRGALGDLEEAAAEAREDSSCYHVERVQGYFL